MAAAGLVQMAPDVSLRQVRESDLNVFFEHQLDTEANRMAAFTTKDPSDRSAFDAHWAGILADPSNVVRTVLLGETVAGLVSKYEEEHRPEVTYWIGREFWGKGVATAALRQFLDIVRVRPIYARAAKDNAPSLRVLQKCGFSIIGEGSGYANARRENIEEFLLSLS